ncbi:hypothetical protein KUTeg_004267, partial [Tegillarca granosa]
AADLYIKEFIHPLVKEGNLDARPLRIYYRHRWVQTVPDVEMSASQGNFRMPTQEDVDKHKIIITTLSTARYLCDLELPTGFFTHIFLDEAAQAMEGEMIIPISLANKDTRIVLAGDHMQLNPEVYADFARQQGFQRSLLERLYELYPEDSPCKIMLVENYRSHADIIDFTSDLFYDGKLTASGNQPKHDKYHPLTFFATRGEEIQHENATGFYNISEIHEIIDRVDDLHKNWPKEWGELGEGSIGVVAPYSDQVWRIRSELRKKKFYNISVEKVMNVQDSSQEDYLDYGFLSNEKLLNTAITRAQSLVITVGDPLSLCLVGKCRKVWEHYLEICNEHGSFLGMTWNQLKAQLNSAEMRKTFVLNPLAPEFVPNRLFHVNRLENINAAVPGFHGQPHHPASASHYMGQRMMYPGAVFPHHMYPPYLQMPYQHLYNPFMYHRPYLPYHQLMGGGLPATRRSPNKVAYPRTASPVGFHGNPKRSGERDKVSPEAMRGVDSPPLVSKKVANNASNPRTMVYMPRMPPTAYPPMYYYPPQAYGGYYYMPDDPRLAAMQHPQLPYLQHHPFTSISPHPGGLYHASPLRPHLAQQHSPESASFLGEGDHSPEKGSPHRGSPLSQGKDLRPYSPSVSPGSTVAGQSIRLLPNVKHVPEHLISGARAHTPTSNSRSSTPHRTDSPDVYQQDSNNRKEVVGSPEEPNYFKTVSPVLDNQERRASAQSPLARVIASAKRQGSPSMETELGTSPQSRSFSTYYKASVTVSREATSPVHNGERHDGNIMTSSKLERNHHPGSLQLQTGFSRQFSEDLATPTEITNIVKMIDESIDEQVEEEEENNLSKKTSSSSSYTQRITERTHTEKLFLNIPHQAPLNTSNRSPSSSPPNGDDHRPTYAGVLRRSLPPAQPEMDLVGIEPQTPHTPAGFTTPNAEIDTDPLGILRNLNINSSAENHRTYKYFS